MYQVTTRGPWLTACSITHKGQRRRLVIEIHGDKLVYRPYGCRERESISHLEVVEAIELVKAAPLFFELTASAGPGTEPAAVPAEAIPKPPRRPKREKPDEPHQVLSPSEPPVKRKRGRPQGSKNKSPRHHADRALPRRKANRRKLR